MRDGWSYSDQEGWSLYELAVIRLDWIRERGEGRQERDDADQRCDMAEE